MKFKKILLSVGFILATFTLIGCKDREPISRQYSPNPVLEYKKINDDNYSFVKPPVTLTNYFHKLSYESNIRVLVGTDSGETRDFEVEAYCDIVAGDVRVKKPRINAIVSTSNQAEEEFLVIGFVTYEELLEAVDISNVDANNIELRFGNTLKVYDTVLKGNETIVYLSIENGEIEVKDIK